jgi:hypothetical protein
MFSFACPLPPCNYQDVMNNEYVVVGFINLSWETQYAYICVHGAGSTMSFDYTVIASELFLWYISFRVVLCIAPILERVYGGLELSPEIMDDLSLETCFSA